MAEHLDGLRLTKIAVELDYEPLFPPKSLAQNSFGDRRSPNDDGAGLRTLATMSRQSLRNDVRRQWPGIHREELGLWASFSGVLLDFSRPGKPTDNAVIESFIGRLRDECLDQHWFLSLDEARAVAEACRRDTIVVVRTVLWAT